MLNSPMTYHFKSDVLVREVRSAIKDKTPGWEDKVELLCQYHLEMRNHALTLERIIHRITKGEK